MKAYKKLLDEVYYEGDTHNDRTGVGTLSLFGRTFRHTMCLGFPLLTTKRIPFRWVAEELFWFLSGSTDERELRARGVDIWKEWATAEQCAKFGREEGDLGPVYGKLWRAFPGMDGGADIDQIAALMNDIEHNPGSRRLIVSAWHPGTVKQVALPACHSFWQIKCHEQDRSMSMHLYQRSADLFLGVPFNIASYALLLELIAFCTGYSPSELIITFGDLHIYRNHIDAVDAQRMRAPRPLPRLSINRRLAGSGLNGLISANWMDLSLSDYDPHPKIDAEVAI